MPPAEDAHDPTNVPPDFGDPAVWERVVGATGPASLLVVIASRMGDGLRRRHPPEDVFGETLLHAYRSRDTIRWQGPRAFRRWLLNIAENRIRDLQDRERTAKRGGGIEPVRICAVEQESHGVRQSPEIPGPAASTTPSLAASRREEAAILQAALDSLPEADRAIILLRLFEELTMPEIARRLRVSLSTAKHRFSTAITAYRERLSALRSSRDAMRRE